MTDYNLLLAAAVIRDKDGADRYYYRPAVIRGELHDADRLKQLVREGILEPVTPAEAAADAPLEQPAKSASKPDWVAFAVQEGIDEAVAKKAKKDELVAHFVDGAPLPTGSEPTDGTDVDAGASSDPGEDPGDDPGDPTSA